MAGQSTADDNFMPRPESPKVRLPPRPGNSKVPVNLFPGIIEDASKSTSKKQFDLPSPILQKAAPNPPALSKTIQHLKQSSVETPGLRSPALTPRSKAALSVNGYPPYNSPYYNNPYYNNPYYNAFNNPPYNNSYYNNPYYNNQYYSPYSNVPKIGSPYYANPAGIQVDTKSPQDGVQFASAGEPFNDLYYKSPYYSNYMNRYGTYGSRFPSPGVSRGPTSASAYPSPSSPRMSSQPFRSEDSLPSFPQPPSQPFPRMSRQPFRSEDSLPSSPQPPSQPFIIPKKKNKKIVIKNADGEVINLDDINTLRAASPHQLSEHITRPRKSSSPQNSPQQSNPSLHSPIGEATQTLDENSDALERVVRQELSKDTVHEQETPGAEDHGSHHADMSSPIHQMQECSESFIDAESTLDGHSAFSMQRTAYESSISGRTYSTRPTTNSNSQFSEGPFNKVINELHSIAEESEMLIGDGESTISADSMVYLTSDQQFLITERFSGALLEGLPRRGLQLHSPQLHSSEFSQSFTALLKDYSKEVSEGAPRHSRNRKASKAVRILRKDILCRFQDAVGNADISRKEKRVPTLITRQADDSGLKEKTIEEKFSDWNIDVMIDCPDNTPPLDDHVEDVEVTDHDKDYTRPRNSQTDVIPTHKLLDSNPSISSHLDSDETSMVQSVDEVPSLANPEDQETYAYLTNHDAFLTLLRNLQVLVEQRLCNQMELIRHRISLALRRPGIVEQANGAIFSACFTTQWDAIAFLEDQYPAGRLQSLRNVLALTGSSTNAQLTTVERYLHQTWPNYPDILIDAFSRFLGRSAEAHSGISDIARAISVVISPDGRTVYVSGSESFIISVAQQLAWLGAACRSSLGQIATCYTAFSEVEMASPDAHPGPNFNITYDICSVGTESIGSCWHDLVGDSVVAAGFHIPERASGEAGLSLSLELMGALVKIPLATRFYGGYILKGRSIVLVPVERKGNSIQWHMIKKENGSRLNFRELHNLCASRLSFEEYNESDFSSTECFLGWCPKSVNNLATEQYDHLSIGYSAAPPVSRRYLSLTGFSVGFSQWGQGILNFALGKKDGLYHNQKAKYYEDLLDDAAQIHVVLQDMKDRRGWWTTAEATILQILLHRHAQKPFRVNQATVHLKTAVSDDPMSVREAMMANSDVIVKRDRQIENAQMMTKTFTDVVGELYTQFEGIMANQEEFAKEPGWELKLDRASHLYGWEYMDLVNRKHDLKLRGIQLRKTCGGWPRLMREVDAVVLFGVGFDSLIQPAVGAALCSGMTMLPCQKDYLAMEVATLDRLYIESGASVHTGTAQVTLSGTHLHPSKHLFDPCPYRPRRGGGHGSEKCTCERVQQIVFKRQSKNMRKLSVLDANGAIIIGQGSGTWIEELGKSMSTRNLSKKPAPQATPVSLVKSANTTEATIRNSRGSGTYASSEYSAFTSTRSTSVSGTSTVSTVSTEPSSISSSRYKTGDHSFSHPRPRSMRDRGNFANSYGPLNQFPLNSPKEPAEYQQCKGGPSIPSRFVPTASHWRGYQAESNPPRAVDRCFPGGLTNAPISTQAYQSQNLSPSMKAEKMPLPQLGAPVSAHKARNQPWRQVHPAASSFNPRLTTTIESVNISRQQHCLRRKPNFAQT